MPQVSIIVPVYQVAPYLRQCVDSILAQTFRDFELLLVDDGSTDGSGAICDEYAAADGRVRVIHQENGGVAAARNRGIDGAAGEYLCFVDGDDWLEAGLLGQCVAHMRRTGAEVLRHGHTVELWQNGACAGSETKPAPDFAGVLTHRQIADEMERFWPYCSNYVWNYFFAREAVGGMRFPALTISEDHVFVLEVLRHCRTICFLAENGYHYCMRMGSSANRWQEAGIDCQMEMVQACHRFMTSFDIPEDRKNRLLAPLVLNAYSYAIYLLCFPSCRWTVRRKLARLRLLRDALAVDRYVPHAGAAGLPPADRLKHWLIRRKQEWLLVLIGPLFLRVVRKVNQ